MNKANKYGDTPLMITVRNGESGFFRFLAEIVVNINKINTKNDTYFHLRPESNSVNIMKIS